MSMPKSNMHNSPSSGNTGGILQKVSPEETNFPSISSNSTIDRLLNRSMRTGLQYSSVLHGTAMVYGVYHHDVVTTNIDQHIHVAPGLINLIETALNHVSKLRV